MQQFDFGFAVFLLLLDQRIQESVLLGHARGVAMLAAAEVGLSIAAYPPAVVKRAIVGSGETGLFVYGVLNRLLIVTGLSGALYGIYLSFVSVEGFPFLLSIEALAILIVGGEAIRMCTSFAPASRIIWTIFTLVVPRTIESSISTIRLPSTSARLALCLRFTSA